MVEFVHNNIIVKIRCSLCSKILRIERLNRDKQMINIIWPVVSYEQFSEICILQHSSEGIHALPEYFFPVCNKQ